MQDKLEATLADLIAFRSESEDFLACQQITEYVYEQLKPLGLHIVGDINCQHPWLLATTQRTKSPKILLTAHLDVVPASDYKQYELRKDNGKLYGRGVWDMKYAAAGFIELAKAKREELEQLDFGILFTTDEEIGGYQGVREVLRQGWRTELAFIPDYGDNWKIEENAKGIFVDKLSASGKSAHGSRPWEGVNAIQKLIPVLHELQSLYPSIDQLGPTLSINQFSGGRAMTQIPDGAYALLDFRSFRHQEIDDYQLLLRKLAWEYGLTIEEAGIGQPLTLDKENYLVQKYLETLQTCGITPIYEKSFGATDGRWFAEYGIPCIVTGPHGHGAHGDDEWIVRQDLVTFYNLIDHYISNNTRFKTLDEASATAHTNQ